MTTKNAPANSEILKVALKAAERAATIAREQRASLTVAVSFKDARNLVTTADLAAEKAIIETILEHFPDHKILAEESAQGAHPRAVRSWPTLGNRPYRWNYELCSWTFSGRNIDSICVRWDRTGWCGCSTLPG